MAYYRTLKSGEQRLIYTAKDKAKQRQRYQNRPYPYTPTRKRCFDKQRAQEYLRFLYQYYDGIGELSQEIAREENDLARLREELAHTLKFIHAEDKQAYFNAHHRNIRHSGSVEECRYWISEIQDRLRRYRWIMNNAR